jgi:hypothetical protein
MIETVEPKDLNLGSLNAPEPLLSLLVCLLPLAEINSAIATCQELHGHAITDYATAYLEGVLIDDNVHRLDMTPVALVEWGPTGWIHGDHHASIYTLRFPAHGELVVARWWNETPGWWSYGECPNDIDAVVESLERQVGRTCNRVVWQIPA